MATKNRRATVDLIRALQREPHRYGFFQAIRLLALATPSEGDALGLPRQVRFRTPAAFGFPASEISAVAQSSQGGPLLEMEVSFLGLTGPSGVLPQHYTETLLERRHLHRDSTLHAFLDLFNHRACALFYAAWRKYRFQIAYEQGHRDGFTRQLSQLLAMRLPGTGPREPAHAAVAPSSLLYFAGALARRPLPSCSLVAFLSTYFQVKVRLEPFVGQWTQAPLPEQTRLGAEVYGLGEGAFLGERLWDQQHKIRLHLGPLSGPQFREFLPGRPGATALRQFVNLQLGELLACDLVLSLSEAAVPAPQLASRGLDAPRLGLNIWLPTRSRPATQVAFRLQS